MRLTPTQATIIREAVHRHFGEDADVRLCGSRTDDSKRGGDIDLYIEADIPAADSVFRKEMALLAELYIKLGEQKIDLVVKQRGQTTELPIHRVARETGVRL